MHPTEVFARYASEFRQQPLPAEVIHHAKRAVIDWYASLFPGIAAAPVRLLEDTLADDLDRGPARSTMPWSCSGCTQSMERISVAVDPELDAVMWAGDDPFSGFQVANGAMLVDA